MHRGTSTKFLFPLPSHSAPQHIIHLNVPSRKVASSDRDSPPMSLDDDADLEDALALFEQQIEQVTATPTLQTPAPKPPPSPSTPQSFVPTVTPSTPSPKPVTSQPALPIQHKQSKTISVLPPRKSISSLPLQPTPSADAASSSQTVDKSSVSTTHRWFWNGNKWLWVPRHTVPKRKPLPVPSPSTSSSLHASRLSTSAPATLTGPSLPHLPSNPVQPSIGDPFAAATSAATATTASDAFVPEVDGTPSNTNSVSSPAPSEAASLPPSHNLNVRKTITKRTAAGQVWHDTTMSDWPDNDHRLFVGDLGPDATDEDLISAFSKYSSFNMARVVKDKRSNTCRGYGFVSFASAQDMVNAVKQMNGKYVGSRPIKLRRSNWQNRTLHKDKWKQVRALRSITKH